jgi:hypothetical protein
MQKAPGAALRGLYFADRRQNYMGFGAAGAVLVAAGFFLAGAFFLVVFFVVDFFAGAFFAGAFFAGAVAAGAEVVGAVLCACAVTNGTVDAPTNASRANAEINAFIFMYS